MTARSLATAFLSAHLATLVFSADEPAEKRTTAKDAMRAQMMEDAKKKSATSPTPVKSAPAAPSRPAAKPTAPAPVSPSPATPVTPISETTAPTTDLATSPTTAAATPATVLPKVEVNRGKLHPLARELFDKEQEVAREKQLTKPTELDKALNDPKLTIPLFGGQSTSSRASIAAERTALLEAEADLIEEIGRARTQEQKAELRKQLDELKKVRRDLEHAVR
jgi:hypothetical protein